MITTRINATQVLEDLKKHYTWEEIAVMVGKSYNTIYLWRKGEDKPGKGDYELLCRMLDKAKIKKGE